MKATVNSERGGAEIEAAPVEGAGVLEGDTEGEASEGEDGDDEGAGEGEVASTDVATSD